MQPSQQGENMACALQHSLHLLPETFSHWLIQWQCAATPELHHQKTEITISLLSSGSHFIFYHHWSIWGHVCSKPLLQECNNTQAVAGNEVQG